MAGMLLMGMYWPEISAFKAETLAAGKPLVANGGPASLLCTFPNPTQTYVLFPLEKSPLYSEYITLLTKNPATSATSS